MTDEDNPQWIYVHFVLKAAGCPPIAHAVLFLSPHLSANTGTSCPLTVEMMQWINIFFPVLLLAVREDIQSP